MNILMLVPGDSIHGLRAVDAALSAGYSVLAAGPVNPIPEGRTNYRFISLMPADHRAGVLALRQIRESFAPALCHVHWFDVRVAACLAAGLHPLVVSAWGSDVNQHFLPGFSPERRSEAGRILAGVDAVVCGCADQAQKCDVLAPGVRVEILNLGVNTVVFRPGHVEPAAELRRQLRISPEARVLLSARAWSEYYNHHLILEAFAKGMADFNREAVLLFKVYNPAYRDSADYLLRVQNSAAALGVSEHVRWVHAVPAEALPAVYTASSALVNYPSRDSFSATIQEAVACERPVVSIELPAYRDCGLEAAIRFVAPGDADGLRRGLVDAVNGTLGITAEHLVAARRCVIQRYDERRYRTGLLALYRDLIGKEPANA